MSIRKTLLVGMENSYRSYKYHPEGAIAFLTYRCTSRCKTCNIWKRPLNDEPELTWSEWKPVMEKMAKNNLKSIELFGGDALLRKDLLIEMLHFCRDAGIETFFPTNSNLIDEETAGKLIEAGLGTIYFSLDELPSIKGSVRGIDDSFEKVNSAVHYVKKQRGNKKLPRMVCITTVSRLNYHILDDFLEYVNSIPFDGYMLRGLSEFKDAAVAQSAVNGIYPAPYFMLTGDVSNLYSHSEAEELLIKIEAVKLKAKENNYIYVNTENMEFLTVDNLNSGTYPKLGCQFCRTQMVLTPSANVVPCLYFTNYILGNLQNREIVGIWGNKKHRDFCQLQKKDKIAICDYCSIKFYHQSFPDTVRTLLKKVKKKIKG